MKKEDYRSFFASCKPWLKMSYFLKEIGLLPVTFSLFMRGKEQDYQISLDRLRELYDLITETCNKIA